MSPMGKSPKLYLSILIILIILTPGIIYLKLAKIISSYKIETLSFSVSNTKKETADIVLFDKEGRGNRHCKNISEILRKHSNNNETSNNSIQLLLDDVCSCTKNNNEGFSWNPSTLWTELKPRLRAALIKSVAISSRRGSMEEKMKSLQSNPLVLNWTTQILDVLSIYKLNKSIKVPSNPLVMERVLEVLLKRLHNPDKNPPLRIGIIGGSVTHGTGCGWNSLGLNLKGTRRVCPFPYPERLEHIINYIFMGEKYSGEKINKRNVVVVKNMAIAGTNSIVMRHLLEFNLWPDNESGPQDYDIIILSLGSNDGQGPFLPDMFTSEQKIIQILQNKRPCSDLPLVAMVEDNFMDATNTDHQTFRYHRDMVTASSWEGAMAISHGDILRDHLYHTNLSDTTIWNNNLHPGMEFHCGVALVLTWSLMNGLIKSCWDAKLMVEHDNPIEPRYGIPPPILEEKKNYTEYYTQWRTEQKERELICSQQHGFPQKTKGIKNSTTTGDNNTTQAVTNSQCAYSWLASKFNQATKQQVQHAVSSVATLIDGWVATGYPVKKPRRTFEATKKNASFTIQLENLRLSNINQMMIMYIKSYGNKWKNSQLLVEIYRGKNITATTINKINTGNDTVALSNNNTLILPTTIEWKVLSTVQLSGLHNSTTSVNYIEKIDLGNNLEKGDILQATFTLTDGAVFQINGLAVCNIVH